jgi:crotonobetainyl-CoA hydratase
VPDPAALVDRVDHTMVVTINRPEVSNAVDAAVSAIVGDALEEADRDPDVRVVVLTGAGDRAFCAGIDLAALARGERVFAPGRGRWNFAGYVNHVIAKPTIAAVNGIAYGGGLELVLASDLALSARSARFALPEVKRGIIAAAGGAFRIAEQLPKKLALHLLLTGEPIDANTAYSHGLLNAVVPDGTVLDAALDLAGRIAANAPLAVQASKRIAHGITDGATPDSARWQQTYAELNAVLASEDAKEGPKAFAEKRAPVWRGR